MNKKIVKKIKFTKPSFEILISDFSFALFQAKTNLIFGFKQHHSSTITWALSAIRMKAKTTEFQLQIKLLPNNPVKRSCLTFFLLRLRVWRLNRRSKSSEMFIAMFASEFSTFYDNSNVNSIINIRKLLFIYVLSKEVDGSAH